MITYKHGTVKAIKSIYHCDFNGCENKTGAICDGDWKEFKTTCKLLDTHANSHACPVHHEEVKKIHYEGFDALNEREAIRMDELMATGLYKPREARSSMHSVFKQPTY